jgi:hypothetical protein
LLDNMTVDIKETEVNSGAAGFVPLNTIPRAGKHGCGLARTSRDPAWLTSHHPHKTYSAVYCFARVAPMENSTVLCGQRGDAWLLLGFRQLLDKGHDDEDDDNC